MRIFFLAATLFAFSILVFPRDSYGVTAWENDSGPCMRAFVHPEKAKLEQLAYCMRVWATFRSPSKIPAKERNLAIPAFQRIYKEGNEQHQYDARLVLQSLGATIPKLKKKKKKTGVGRLQGAARKTFVASNCSRRERQNAERFNRKGHRLYKQKRYQLAREPYEEAIDACDAHVLANYNLAATYALLDMNRDSLEFLHRLSDMGTSESLDKLHDARIDADFQDTRQQSGFKLITGYVRIKVLNSVGEFGEEEVERIEKTLTRLRHETSETGTDKYKRKRPFIWYNHLRSSRIQAMLFKDVVDHPETRLKPINWDSEFDIIISWGVRLIKDEYGDSRPAPVARSADPDNLDKKMRSMEHKQNQALREPDQAANKANKVLGTPERANTKANNAVDRTERTLEKIEGVGEKLGF